MGGLAVIAAVVISSLIWSDGLSSQLLTLILCGALFALVGWVDDLLKLVRRSSDGLSVRQKLLLQFLCAACITAVLYARSGLELTQLYIPWFFQQPVDIGPVYYLLAVLYIMMLVNSVNLTDGLDGLAAGLGIISFTAALIVSVAGISVIPGIRSGIESIPGAGDIAVASAGMIGALCGFLLFNRKPARLFMGDTGSQAMGGILAVCGIMLRSEVVFLFISGMFLIETVSVILQVSSWKLRHKRVFNMAPLHHHFELAGKSEISIVRVFWGIGTLFSAAGVGIILFG